MVSAPYRETARRKSSWRRGQQRPRRKGWVGHLVAWLELIEIWGISTYQRMWIYGVILRAFCLYLLVRAHADE
jgi:hypothetical protein